MKKLFVPLALVGSILAVEVKAQVVVVKPPVRRVVVVRPPVRVVRVAPLPGVIVAPRAVAVNQAVVVVKPAAVVVRPVPVIVRTTRVITPVPSTVVVRKKVVIY